jgi:hypothetical protein
LKDREDLQPTTDVPHGSTSAVIEALQQEDYVRFASLYNGPGQASVYGARIEDFVRAFQSM